MKFSIDNIKNASQCKCNKRVNKYFLEYCDNSGIHGFRYFAQKRTTPEIIYWFIVMSVSMIFMAFMIYGLAEKFISIPVIVSFSTRQTPLYEVPFPTVTICSKAKISADYFNYTNVMMKLRKNETVTKTEKEYNNYAAMICEDELRNETLRNRTYSYFVSDDFYNFLNKTKRNFFHFCYLFGEEIPCDEYFTPMFTDEGVCYSFNFLNHSDFFQDDVYHNSDFYQVSKSTAWDIENGYWDQENLNSYPFRSLGTGASRSLFIVMYSKRNSVDELCSSDDSGGYLVNVGLPGKIPTMNEASITIGSNMNVLGTIDPTVIKTSEAVRNYAPEKRDCVFPTENPLRFFKIYSQTNCIFECLTNITLKQCDCVGFYMPRTNDTKICGIASYDCMEDAEENLLMADLLHKTSKDPKIKETLYECKCMPICSDINYNLEISVNPWNNNKVLKRKGDDESTREESIKVSWQIPGLFVEDDERVDFASLTLSMKRNHLETRERNEVYGFIDFISGFGGLLGLFCGFSILSLMELIYFLTLRIFGNLRLHGNWYGEKVIEDNPK